jgi:eukaryotic-like serine/threonine-protein kinase
MILNAGAQLGPYRVIEPIGAGGMGTVYRGHDPRLGRDVALKVVDERFSDRFVREAHAVAALSHPNICQLYDVGPNYLVMELVDGITLAERIQQGPAPLDEALPIARQIADALEAAHERGIIHRDLKPGNIKIKPDGTVKVLDFGLAKVIAPVMPSDSSPTMTAGSTEPGVVMGTAAYMAPEQAKGKSVDKRADVWAFGVVLYELVTGRRLFQGETATEVLASVLKEEPRWGLVPPQVQRLLRKCLEKDPQRRLRHVGDLMALVDDVTEVPVAPSSAPVQRRSRWVPIGIVGAAAIVLGILALWSPWRQQAPTKAVRFEIQATDKLTFINGGFPAVSPDGQWVVFPATGSDGVTRQWLRALDSVEVRPLAGTESANRLPPPVFWSPDSQYVAFASTPGAYSPGQLKKLAIAGGPPQTICDVPASVAGGTWSRDDTIVFTNNAGALLRVSAKGGVATPMTVRDPARQETAHSFPQFLPDQRHFLYFRRSNARDYNGIYVGSIDVKPEEQSEKPLMVSNRQGEFVKSAIGGPGWLLFLRETTLFAQPFDPSRLELSGDAVPIADQVGSFGPASVGLFSVSESGVLAYRVGVDGGRTQLTWFDTQGKIMGTMGEKGSLAAPAISPDGTRVAFALFDNSSGNSNIWVADVARGNSTRLTFNSGRDTSPVWSPDGRTIVFSSNRAGHSDLYVTPSDNSGAEQLLFKSDEDKQPTSWSRDGRFVLFTSVNPKNREDIWVVSTQDKKATPFLNTSFQENNAVFSPDGRWVAYLSDESGNVEIYVRPFSADGSSGTGGKTMVSKGGGVYPVWPRDSRQLFYLTQSLEQMAVDVATDKTFHADAPRKLFNTLVLTRYDVSSDGKRFLHRAPDGANTLTPFTIVLNWQAALKK